MTRLGDFGSVRDVPERDTFGWFGTEVRLHPSFGELVFTDWVEEHGNLEETDTRSLTATKTLMRRMIDPEDFDSFWALAVKHRQGSADLLKLLQAVVESVTERPTQSPAVSSVGPVSTVPRSGDDLSSPVIARLEGQGRPDLALVHVQAAEARQAG
jgi:hypothetical protein